MTREDVMAVFVRGLLSGVATILQVAGPEWTATQLREAADAVELNARKRGEWSDVEANTQWFDSVKGIH